jgi:hypothetical protein
MLCETLCDGKEPPKSPKILNPPGSYEGGRGSTMGGGSIPWVFVEELVFGSLVEENGSDRDEDEGWGEGGG